MTRIQFHYEIEIAAAPDAVWKVLGDLPATHHWLPGLVAARFDGVHRSCATVDGAEIVEEITNRDERSRSFAYAHVKTPAPMKGSRGTYRVVAAPQGSKVLWDGGYEPADPGNAKAIEAMLDGYFRQSLDSLKRFIETGRRWSEA